MYNVALLIERPLADLDADQVVALHEGIDELVTYHLLLPVVHTPDVLFSSMAGLGDITPAADPAATQELHEHVVEAGESDLEGSVELLRSRGQQVTSALTEDDPVHALKELVDRVDANEAIILTEPHFVREFLHVDWTSRARRKLNVPTLHLIEHVPFAAQQ